MSRDDATLPRRRIIVAAPDSRSQRGLFLSALPAVVGVLSCVILSAVLALRSPGQDLAWYRQLGQAALDRGDAQLAQICYQRLLVADPSDQEAAFALGKSLLAMGRSMEAVQMLLRIAPEAGGGLPAAHLFLAEQFARDGSQPLLIKARLHLAHAQNNLPEDPETHAVAALLAYREQNWAKFEAESRRSGEWRGALERWVLEKPRQ